MALRTKSRRVRSLQQFLESPGLEASRNLAECSIDLGCGALPRELFPVKRALGIDVVKSLHPNTISSDLIREPIPVADQSISYVYAFDFLEHVPRYSGEPTKGSPSPFINLMNEIHRILESGGVFLSSTPAYPYPQAFQDPTHVNILTEQTLPLYFCRHKDGALPWARQYGFTGEFELISQAWCEWSLLAALRRI